MNKLFISHSSKDDAFVRDLRAALADHEQHGWIDSRELRGGDPLWSEIEKAINEASGYAVVVSPDALQSKWVGKELKRALAVRDQRGKDNFPVIPLSLNGTQLGVLEEYFGEEPTYIAVSNKAGGVEAAMNAILIALGKRDPADTAPTQQPKAEPLEELVLELSDLKFHEQDNIRRASARARLVYEPATPGQREVASVHSWPFVAPLGPIEAEELRWYLEKYAIWPSEYFRDRARKVEGNLVKWGQLLYAAALPIEHTANVINAWSRIEGHAGRRFSVHVDAALVAGAPGTDIEIAHEAAAKLLSLPWELLHDGEGFLFQGAKPMCVRRRLPNIRVLEVPIVETPVRILLITARPEDDSCNFIDHRVTALPLFEAMEDLGSLVSVHLLSPPTLPSLRDELERARCARKPYHVVHFDGYGVYDRLVGLGALCFEAPEDSDRLERRRHASVTTTELGPLLRDHRIPLIFLGAFSLIAAKKVSESIASELLELGTVSVAAMSHSVGVETVRRFVRIFYGELARGNRVGDGMLRGQRKLKDDAFRGRVFGAGELRLDDWFVPVLFQEKDDPQLFRAIPDRQATEDLKIAVANRLGELPAEPETGFVGQSRQLLALQRLLYHERYAVVRGQGGEGKTALAAELARWMVRSRQIRRAAFISVETHSNHLALLDVLGRQLIGKHYSVAAFEDLEKAILPVERALAEQSTLLVVDNMESILLPPYLETPETLSEEARHELGEILQLCARLNAKGDTRLVFASREALTAPFDGERHRRELGQLDREDAIKLVERALNQDATGAGSAVDATLEAIEQLVDAVHCHARTLALLAPSLRGRGVESTRESLVELMAEMDERFPGSREKSLFASVELSLRRLSEANRNRARVLAVFHGVVDLDVLSAMMEWEKAEVASLAVELVETGLATQNRYNHLTLNPALCPYLRGRMDAAERKPLSIRWYAAMRKYVSFLHQQQSEKIDVAATLTVLELPNIFALLEHVQREGDAEATIDLSTSLYSLLQNTGKPRLLERVGHVRDAAVATLGDAWNHTRFNAAATSIEQQLADARLGEALDSAQHLLQRAMEAGETEYLGADYDLASAYILLARVLEAAGSPEQAFPLLVEARNRFEAIDGVTAARMVHTCLVEQGECLLALGRLDDAATAFEDSLRRAEQLGDARSVATAKGQLGSVRKKQGRYEEALAAYEEARELFTRFAEPDFVAMIWHQTGIVYEEAEQPEAAEDAYRKSLAIKLRLGNVAGQASTLGQLGNLYDGVLRRSEEAVAFYRQAADRYVEILDVAGEIRTRNNLAATLRKLHLLDDARLEIRRAIECDAKSGHVGQPWTSWSILADIETDAGNAFAAAEANRRAVVSYLAYRRDGGENHHPEGRISLAVTRTLLVGDSANAASLLHQFAPDSNEAWLLFIRALQAIVSGSRDRTLADAPDLNWMMAAEILLLIEILEKSQSE